MAGMKRRARLQSLHGSQVRRWSGHVGRDCRSSSRPHGIGRQRAPGPALRPRHPASARAARKTGRGRYGEDAERFDPAKARPAQMLALITASNRGPGARSGPIGRNHPRARGDPRRRNSTCSPIPKHAAGHVDARFAAIQAAMDRSGAGDMTIEGRLDLGFSGGVLTHPSPFGSLLRGSRPKRRAAGRHQFRPATNAANHLENAWAENSKTRRGRHRGVRPNCFAEESLAPSARRLRRAGTCCPLLSGDLRPEMVESASGRRQGKIQEPAASTNNLPAKRPIGSASGRSLYIAEVMALFDCIIESAQDRAWRKTRSAHSTGWMVGKAARRRFLAGVRLSRRSRRQTLKNPAREMGMDHDQGGGLRPQAIAEARGRRTGLGVGGSDPRVPGTRVRHSFMPLPAEPGTPVKKGRGPPVSKLGPGSAAQPLRKVLRAAAASGARYRSIPAMVAMPVAATGGGPQA